MSLRKDTREAFRAISTASISDAFDELGIRGIATGIMPVYPEAKIVGPAVTMRQVPTQMGETLIKQWDVIERVAKPGDVIVIDAGGRKGIVSWAGIMSLGAKIRGIEGVVVDGATRDVDQIRSFKFPVFARGLSPVRSATRYETVCINEPIQLDDVQVKPGDLIIGDEMGIAVVPKGKVEEVLKLAMKKEESDRIMEEELRKGHSREEALAAVKKRTRLD